MDTVATTVGKAAVTIAAASMEAALVAAVGLVAPAHPAGRPGASLAVRVADMPAQVKVVGAHCLAGVHLDAEVDHLTHRFEIPHIHSTVPHPSYLNFEWEMT